jgi:hypothetical protein
VKWSPGLIFDVPPAVVTWTSTVWAVLLGGDTAVIEVLVLLVKLVAGTPPNVTAVGPDRLVPWMVTVVPPLNGPELGRTEEIVPAGTTMGAEAICSAEAVEQLNAIGAPPLRLAWNVELGSVDTETVPEAFAVNGLVAPGAMNVSDAGGGLVTRVVGRV